MVSSITPEATYKVWPLFFRSFCFVFLTLIFIDCHLSFLDNPLTHLFVRTYCVAIDLMAQVKCYRAVLEVSELGVITTPDLT
jgi:hypothetical protein